MDAIVRGDSDCSRVGKTIILPSSHIGGPRCRAQNYQDAMAICRWDGYPDLFLTFTCNPKWPEINEMQNLYHKRMMEVMWISYVEFSRSSCFN